MESEVIIFDLRSVMPQLTTAFSVDFARYVLQEHTYPSERSLFNFAKLKESNVVELG